VGIPLNNQDESMISCQSVHRTSSAQKAVVVRRPRT
jgi:hypothetical protein